MERKSIQSLHFPPDPTTFINALRLLSSKGEFLNCQNATIQIICNGWKRSNNLIDFLTNCVIFDSNVQYSWLQDIRLTALKAILFNFPTHLRAVELLRDRALNDPDEQLREWAQEQLKEMEER